MTENYFWGKPDGLVNFCEEKYHVNPYISEFWNSISNLSYIYVGYRVSRIPTFSNSIYAVGLASFLFHATGRFYAEVLDEFSMCFLVLLIYCHSDQVSKEDIHFLTSIMILNFIFYVKYKLFIIFYFLYTSMVIITFSKFYYKKGIGEFLMYFIPAKICWLIEQNYCQDHQELYIFHSLWHILSAMSLYKLTYLINKL